MTGIPRGAPTPARVAARNRATIASAKTALASLSSKAARQGGRLSGADAAEVQRLQGILADMARVQADPVWLNLNPEQATALYDLLCWYMDEDAGLADVNHLDALTPEIAKDVTTALITAGANGKAYL